MRLDFVRSLIQQATGPIVSVGAVHYNAPTPSPRGAGASLGISVGQGVGDYKLAVRVVERTPQTNLLINTMSAQARGEIDVQDVGLISAAPPIPAHAVAQLQQRHRPLFPGQSISHHTGTAGTIGGFAEVNGNVHILSNNHVLTDTSQGNLNDPIVQPGPIDGGALARDTVAIVDHIHPIASTGNVADVALAVLVAGTLHDVTYGGTRIQGIRDPVLNENVWKIGRTTGVTRGRVRTTEMVDLPVKGWGRPTVEFDNAFEVVGTESSPFSQGGDSGSLVISDDNFALGLLFAGSGTVNATYVNPLLEVQRVFNFNLLI